MLETQTSVREHRNAETEGSEDKDYDGKGKKSSEEEEKERKEEDKEKKSATEHRTTLVANTTGKTGKNYRKRIRVSEHMISDSRNYHKGISNIMIISVLYMVGAQ